MLVKFSCCCLDSDPLETLCFGDCFQYGGIVFHFALVVANFPVLEIGLIFRRSPKMISLKSENSREWSYGLLNTNPLLENMGLQERNTYVLSLYI